MGLCHRSAQNLFDGIGQNRRRGLSQLVSCTSEGRHAVQRVGGDVRFGGLVFDVRGV